MSTAYVFLVSCDLSVDCLSIKYSLLIKSEKPHKQKIPRMTLWFNSLNAIQSYVCLELSSCVMKFISLM